MCPRPHHAPASVGRRAGAGELQASSSDDGLEVGVDQEEYLAALEDLRVGG